MGGLSPPFFLFTEIFLRWPDQLSVKNLDRPIRYWNLEDVAVAIRTGSYSSTQIESALLAHQAINKESWEDCQILRSCLYFFCCERNAFSAALDSLRSVNPSRLEVRILTLVFWLQTDNLQALASAPSDLWRNEESNILLKLCRIAFLLTCDELQSAENLLDSLGFQCLESCLLTASLHSKLGNYQSCVDIVLPLVVRAPNCLRLYRQAIMHLIDGRDGENIMKIINSALDAFGEHPELLHHVTTVNLYRRQPGLARRSALLTQASCSVRVTPTNNGNHITAYDMNGTSDWLDYLLPEVVDASSSLDIIVQSNLCMQLASVESRLYPGHVSRLLAKISTIDYNEPIKKTSPGVDAHRDACSDDLRIAWITPDLAYHPVSRFLFGFFKFF